ncbi:MAG TPA: hypothetical protein VK614_02420 [Allosphingosinicella sp.]|nr:hypothetical protein [Allosphingosinicella sp.]
MDEIESWAATVAGAAAETLRHLPEAIRETLFFEVPPHGRRREYALAAAAPAGEFESVVMRGGIKEIAHRIHKFTHGIVPI